MLVCEAFSPAAISFRYPSESLLLSVRAPENLVNGVAVTPYARIEAAIAAVPETIVPAITGSVGVRITPMTMPIHHGTPKKALKVIRVRLCCRLCPHPYRSEITTTAYGCTTTY